MNARGKVPIRRIVNFFGAAGYSLLILGYVLAAIATIFWLLRTTALMPPGVVSEAQPAIPIAEPLTAADIPTMPLALRIIQLLFAAVILATVLFVSVTLPYWLGRSGSFLLKRCIRLCHLPVTLPHLLIGKGIACGIGAVPVLLAGLYGLSRWSIILFTLGSLTLALFVFIIQHHLAARSEVVEAKDVW